ncbi:MAG: hypothetical protein ACI3ZT_05815, partial [Candidatus Cryptobacteroides sp.]
TTQSVANAMAAVVDYWDGHPDDVTRKFGCRNAVETIQMLYSQVSGDIRDARSFISDNWTEIVRSSIKIDEVALFLSNLKEFFCKLRSFEYEFCRNDLKAFSTFDDAWIARKYFVMMLESRAEYSSIFGAFESVGNSRPHQARPFSGMARAFRQYFQGVGDSDLADLIVDHKPFAKPVLWLGQRQDAVIFAESFGLSAADMNHSFTFPGKHCEHRNLGLKKDSPSRPYSEYGIWAAIQLYEHCTVL